MADETRTVVKDFNRRLLTRDLNLSALPFEKLDLAGFVKKDRFEVTPAPGPRVIVDDKVANIQDIAQPGEIRFVFTTALTPAEDTLLDTELASHTSTDRTQPQARQERDTTQLDELELEWPDWDTLNNAQRFVFLRKLSRLVIRLAKQSAAF